MGVPQPENKRFYPALDGLRAVAVLMVFASHYVPVRAYFAWGWAGVDIFFVLSGFLITGILYDTRNTRHRLKNFYARRTLRIFPLYYGVLLAALLTTPIFHWAWSMAWYLWALYLGNYAHFIWFSDFTRGTDTIEHLRSASPFPVLFSLDVGHFWSLCVEEQFYLIWPLVVYSIRDRVRLRNICFALCFLSLAARIVAVNIVPQAYLNTGFVYSLTPFRGDALLLGGALALMLRGPEARKVKTLVVPAFVLWLIGFVIFETVYAVVNRHPYGVKMLGSVTSTIGYTLIDIFAGIIILLSIDPRTFIHKALNVKPLRSLGKVSYGFYVFHALLHNVYAMIVTHCFDKRHINLIVAPVALCSTLTLAYLSFRFLEQPFLRLKTRFMPSEM